MTGQPDGADDQAELHRIAAGLERVQALLEHFEVRLKALDHLEARLEALDASFVRHQGQNEDDFRRAEQTVDRVGQELDHHLGDHWRSGR